MEILKFEIFVSDVLSKISGHLLTSFFELSDTQITKESGHVITEIMSQEYMGKIKLTYQNLEFDFLAFYTEEISRIISQQQQHTKNKVVNDSIWSLFFGEFLNQLAGSFKRCLLENFDFLEKEENFGNLSTPENIYIKDVTVDNVYKSNFIKVSFESHSFYIGYNLRAAKRVEYSMNLINQVENSLQTKKLDDITFFFEQTQDDDDLLF